MYYRFNTVLFLYLFCFTYYVLCNPARRILNTSSPQGVTIIQIRSIRICIIYTYYTLYTRWPDLVYTGQYSIEYMYLYIIYMNIYKKQLPARGKLGYNGPRCAMLVPPPGDGAGSLAHTLSHLQYPVLLASSTICGAVCGVRALHGGRGVRRPAVS